MCSCNNDDDDDNMYFVFSPYKTLGRPMYAMTFDEYTRTKTKSPARTFTGTFGKVRGANKYVAGGPTTGVGLGRYRNNATNEDSLFSG